MRLPEAVDNRCNSWGKQQTNQKTLKVKLKNMPIEGFESSSILLGIMKATGMQRPLCTIRKDLRWP